MSEVYEDVEGNEEVVNLKVSVEVVSVGKVSVEKVSEVVDNLVCVVVIR